MRTPRHALRRSRTYLHGVVDSRRREIRMRSHFRRLIDPHALVFDIGASRGDWTAVFRSLGATVVAVESVRETADGRGAGFAETRASRSSKRRLPRRPSP